VSLRQGLRESWRKNMNLLPLEEYPLSARESPTPRTKAPVVEFPLLLEAWLLRDLESAAEEHGMTAGALARRLLREFLYYAAGEVPKGDAPTSP
jgi:hypothetical protein